MGEQLLVHAVHLCEVVHARQEHVDLDDLFDRRPRGLEHGGKVLDALLRHLRDAVRRLREDLARGCAGDLPGAVDRVGGGDCLGLGGGDGR